MSGNDQASTIAAERERSIRILRRHAGEIRARGVGHLALVGSIARDEATEASDIDVLIDVPADRKFSPAPAGSMLVCAARSGGERRFG